MGPMADVPDPVQDALHVVVGAALLAVNRLQARRRELKRWLNHLAEAREADQAS